MDSQLDYIHNKSKDSCRGLSPFLIRFNLDTKKNTWQIFIQPLCEFMLPLLAQETTETQINKALKVIRGTFKIFYGMKRGTPNEVIDKLSGLEVIKRAKMMSWVAKENS